MSLKYPPTWTVSTGTNERDIYYFTITDPSHNTDPKNQIMVTFTNYQNCNAYPQPDFQGLKVSTGNWSDQKGFEVRSLCFPDKQFYLRMTAVSSEAKNIEEQLLTTVSFEQADTNGWKKFSDSAIGLEFEYPAYLGHVIVEKTDSKSCPLMKTYSRNGQLQSEDYLIWFSEMQHVGSGGSYVEYRIPIIKTENNTEICGTDLSELRKNLASDTQYQSSVLPQPYATDAFVSTVDTTIGTSANQFYTLYFIQRNSMTVIQPDITFHPYWKSNEEKEIVQKETSKDPFSSIVDFVLHSDNAKQIRNYLADYKRVVTSMKVTN